MEIKPAALKVFRRLIGNNFAHLVGALSEVKRKRLEVSIILSHLPARQLVNLHRQSEWHKPNQFLATKQRLTTSRSRYATMEVTASQVMCTSHDPSHRQAKIRRSSESGMCQNFTCKSGIELELRPQTTS